MVSRGSLLAVLVTALFCGAAGWKVRDWQQDSKDLTTEREQNATLVKSIKDTESGQKTLLARLDSIEVRNTTINRTVRGEVLRVPVYRDCVVPDSGRLLLESAVQQANAGRNPVRGTSSGAEPSDDGRPAGP